MGGWQQRPSMKKGENNGLEFYQKSADAGRF
jgi:hypothetical protein